MPVNPRLERTGGQPVSPLANECGRRPLKRISVGRLPHPAKVAVRSSGMA